MTIQVDGMRRLADSLVSSAEGLVAAEKILHVQTADAAGVRVADLAEMRAAVAQLNADTDEAIATIAAARVEQAAADAAARADTEAARVEQAAADAAARADASAARVELAAADREVRVGDLAAMSEAVAQLNADTDQVIAEFGAIRTEGAGLLRKAMQTIKNIRRGEATNLPAKKPTRKPREATASAEPPAEPVAESDVDPDRRPTPTEIFAFIADHPDGATLVDMEGNFGTPRIVLQRPVKRMLEVDHQIVRDDATGRYFAI